MKKLDKFLLFPIILLVIYLIVRLIDFSKLLFYYPFDYTNDLSSYMAILHFLKEYGFHGIAQNWYNGFIVLKFYSPGWFFFALPLYLLLKDVRIATYASLILMFIIGFVLIWHLGRLENFSKVKRIGFFAFFFANAIAIGNLIRLGRVTELFAWVVFIALFLLIIYYKDKNLDLRFMFLFIPLYFLSIISHFQETILMQFFVLSLFLVKKLKEKIRIVIYSLIGLLLSSFWWFPFVRDLRGSLVDYYVYAKQFLSLKFILSAGLSYIVPLVLLLVFYLYWKRERKKSELLFFSPVLILALLVLFKIIAFIPVLNQVFPDSYIMMFLFFTLYFIFKVSYSKKILGLIGIGVILISILSVVFSSAYTSWFIVPSGLANDTKDLLNEVDGRYLILNSPSKLVYSPAYYSYGAIYLNLSTPDGFSPHEIFEEYRDFVISPKYYLADKDCDNFLRVIKELKTTNIITFDEHCDTLKECGLKEKTIKDNVCLFVLEK